MRNLKKFLALVLAMLMVVSAAATVSAFEDVADDHKFAEAINDLTVKEIVNGYDGETFGPDDAVTRQQMALMMARAITGIVGDDTVWAQGGLVAFEDVTEYQYAIATVVKAGIVDGFLDNTFRPEEGITFIQALKMAVCALGYDDGNLDWWQGYYNVALDLGLTENLNYIVDANQALNRGEVAQLVYNMLYITLADGSDCFASQNFGLATADNLTTFIITATDEQTAYEGMDVAEGGYVGIQTLVNGVPEGDVVYIPVEMFGFEEDEDEAAFLAAYNLVNWNEDEGTFDQIIPVGDSWKIYNTEISSIKNGKFTYDGKNYYPVEEITGTAIKNEVVLYNSTDFGYDNGNKQLFLNAKGEVLGAEGQVVLEAVYSVAGNIVSYLEVSTGKYLSISNATAKYGEVIDEIAQSYTIVDTAVLTGAYELTVYDDDMDGKMDRAYWTPVYMAVKNGFTNTDQHLTEGPFKGWDEGNDGKITGMEDLAKGDVFVYTFNKQLAEVTVLDTLEVKTAVVDYVSTLKIADGYYTIKTTDGETLTVYTDAKVATADAKIGAALQATATAPAKMTDITTDAKFGYVNYETLRNALTHSIHIKYFEKNGVVIFAETYNPEDVFDRIVVKEVVDADIGTLYVDAYIAGEVEEIPVTAITLNGKTVDLSKITWLKMAQYLDALEEGGVYRMVALENGYLLSDVLDYADETTSTKDNAAAFKLYAPIFTKTTITITDGVVDSTCATKANRVRTNDSTVWYFINGAEVYVFEGLVEDGSIDLTDALLLANKVGYSGDNKGVASEVYVFNADLDELEGFGLNNLVAANVYIPYLLNYEYDTAEVFGLDENEYTAIGYYKYASAAIDLDTGDTVDVYSETKLTSADVDKIYVIDSNNVILDDQSKAVSFTTRENVAIDYEDEFITITKDGSIWYDLDKEIETIVIATAGKKLADTKKSTTTKAADVKAAIAAADYVNFINGAWQDGVLVYILSSKPADEGNNDPTDAGEINAAWAAGDVVYDAISDVDTTDAKINGETVVLYNSELGMGKTALIADQNETVADAIDSVEITGAKWRAANYNVYKDLMDGEEGVFAYEATFDWTDAGTFEFSIYDTETGKLMNFKDGQYIIELTFTDVNGGEFAVTVDFIVEAE